MRVSAVRMVPLSSISESLAPTPAPEMTPHRLAARLGCVSLRSPTSQAFCAATAATCTRRNWWGIRPPRHPQAAHRAPENPGRAVAGRGESDEARLAAADGANSPSIDWLVNRMAKRAAACLTLMAKPAAWHRRQGDDGDDGGDDDRGHQHGAPCPGAARKDDLTS